MAARAAVAVALGINAALYYGGTYEFKRLRAVSTPGLDDPDYYFLDTWRKPASGWRWSHSSREFSDQSEAEAAYAKS